MKYSKISLVIKTDKKPPYFIGAQLHGDFGNSLKKVTCINPSFNCEGCFASSNCLYYEFYEETNVLRKYRFDFELGLDYYNFDFYLFDNSTTKLLYVISTLHMMITQNGLGKYKITYKKFDMYINDKSCFQDQQIKLPENFINTFEVDRICQDITIEFVTPLRMQKDNKFVRSEEELELKGLIYSIYNRQKGLLDRDYKKFPYEIKGEIIKRDLNFKEFTRYSSRQKKTMKLGGLIGKIELKGLNKECYEVLKLGELLGVGKQTTFGLGKIKIHTKEV